MDRSAELMLLGFISILLTVGMGIVSKICIPARFGGSMLPCRAISESQNNKKDKGDGSGKGGDPNHDRRKLLWLLAEDMVHRRALAAASDGDDYCTRHVRPLSVKFLRSNLNEPFYRSQICFSGYLWSSLSITYSNQNGRGRYHWSLNQGSISSTYLYLSSPSSTSSIVR